MAKGKSTTTVQKVEVAPRVTRSRNNTEHSQPVSPPSQKRALPDSGLSQSPSKRIKRTLEQEEVNEAIESNSNDHTSHKDAHTETVEQSELVPVISQPDAQQEKKGQGGPSQPPPSTRHLEDTERANPPSPQVREDEEAQPKTSPTIHAPLLGNHYGGVDEANGTIPYHSSHTDEKGQPSIRANPMYWMRQQLFINLQFLAKQILTLYTEIEPDDWVKIEESTEESGLWNSWSTLRSLFQQTELAIGHQSSITHSETPTASSETESGAQSSSKHLTNFTSALLTLTKNGRTYDELTQLHGRFRELFHDVNDPLKDRQISLALDIREEMWKLGVLAHKFTKDEGLDKLFDDDRHTLSDAYRWKILERRTAIQEDMARHLAAKINFGHAHGREIRELSYQALQSKPSPRDSPNEESDEPLSPNTDQEVEASNTIEISDSVQELAATAHKALNGHDEPAKPENHSYTDLQTAETQDRTSAREMKSPGMVAFGESLWSTREAYERAKLAAAEKAAARHKGVPLQPSQRRPWSPEEEYALMAGLDRVQGPHWSQILAMYGTGGSISEVLKDRNQVQLKDKARNLKLFFLKSGHEVPHYLKNVTGELKTRAPNRGNSGSEKRALEDIYGNDHGGISSRPNQFLSAQLFSRAGVEKSGVTDQENAAVQGNRAMDEEDVDLSNAIQLALEAIREKNGQQGEEAGGNDDNEQNANHEENRAHKSTESGTGDNAVTAGS